MVTVTMGDPVPLVLAFFAVALFVVSLVSFFRTPRRAFASPQERFLIGAAIVLLNWVGALAWWMYFRPLTRDRVAFAAD